MDSLKPNHPLKRFAQWILKEELLQSRKCFYRVSRQLSKCMEANDKLRAELWKLP